MHFGDSKSPNPNQKKGTRSQVHCPQEGGGGSLRKIGAPKSQSLLFRKTFFVLPIKLNCEHPACKDWSLPKITKRTLPVYAEMAVVDLKTFTERLKLWVLEKYEANLVYFWGKRRRFLLGVLVYTSENWHWHVGTRNNVAMLTCFAVFQRSNMFAKFVLWMFVTKLATY